MVTGKVWKAAAATNVIEVLLRIIQFCLDNVSVVTIAGETLAAVLRYDTSADDAIVPFMPMLVCGLAGQNPACASMGTNVALAIVKHQALQPALLDAGGMRMLRLCLQTLTEDEAAANRCSQGG